MTDQKIIELIASRKESSALYRLYRYEGKVTGLITGRGGSKEDASDIFQDALMILCEQIWSGNFTLKASLDTYIFGIAFNLWRTKSRSKKEDKLPPEEILAIDESIIEEHLEKEARLNQVEQVIRKLGEPCLQLLTLFYYKKMSMKEIASKMAYKTVNVAKVQKYKCLERARKKMNLV